MELVFSYFDVESMMFDLVGAAHALKISVIASSLLYLLQICQVFL